MGKGRPPRQLTLTVISAINKHSTDSSTKRERVGGGGGGGGDIDRWMDGWIDG